MNGNCENANLYQVDVLEQQWNLEPGDVTLLYGSIPREHIESLPQGKCNQAELPTGCPFVWKCTGKVRFEKQGQEAVIFLTISNPAAQKFEPQYR